jgi:hypothetical protein
LETLVSDYNRLIPGLTSWVESSRNRVADLGNEISGFEVQLDQKRRELDTAVAVAEQAAALLAAVRQGTVPDPLVPAKRGPGRPKKDTSDA